VLDWLNTIIGYDKQLLLFLHSQGSLSWDSFWIFLTTPLHWIPLFIIIFFFGFKAFDFKKTLLITLFTTIGAATALIIVNLIKNYFQRLRPINDLSINNNIRLLIEANDFSFISGHSTVSFTIAFLSFWILKKHYKYAYAIFLFPLFFAYSRIYLAAHFPIDILAGMILGYLIAVCFYKIMQLFVFKKQIISHG